MSGSHSSTVSEPIGGGDHGVAFVLQEELRGGPLVGVILDQVHTGG